jgi:hypothetical protein
MENNWSVLTEDQINEVLLRLDMLYQDLPVSQSAYVLTAIDDIEDILRRRK